MTATIVRVALLAAAFAATARAAACHSTSHNTGVRNDLPIDGDAPVFVKSVANGELFTVGKLGVNQVHVVHLYGKDGYANGYAQGSLLKAEVNATLTGMYDYFTGQVIATLNATATSDGGGYESDFTDASPIRRDSSPERRDESDDSRRGDETDDSRVGRGGYETDSRLGHTDDSRANSRLDQTDDSAAEA